MRPRPIALVVGLGVAGLVAATLLVAARSAPPPPAAVEIATPSPAPTVPPTVVVDVQGAVSRPGVYRLALGARVGDALAAAGGLLPEKADPAGLNRAALLRDGARIYAPARGETPPAGALGSEAERLVNLNRATGQELAALPGIGPSTADRIVRARDRASFHEVDELQTRGLVTARVLADIRDLVTVR